MSTPAEMPPVAVVDTYGDRIIVSALLGDVYVRVVADTTIGAGSELDVELTPEMTRRLIGTLWEAIAVAEGRS